MVKRRAAETSALELERPELGGMFPQTVATNPIGVHSLGIASSAPLTPHRKYLCHSGPEPKPSFMQKLQKSRQVSFSSRGKVAKGF